MGLVRVDLRGEDKLPQRQIATRAGILQRPDWLSVLISGSQCFLVQHPPLPHPGSLPPSIKQKISYLLSLNINVYYYSVLFYY